jgi:hypothetical protein
MLAAVSEYGYGEGTLPGDSDDRMGLRQPLRRIREAARPVLPQPPPSR